MHNNADSAVVEVSRFNFPPLPFPSSIEFATAQLAKHTGEYRLVVCIFYLYQIIPELPHLLLPQQHLQ